MKNRYELFSIFAQFYHEIKTHFVVCNVYSVFAW